MVQNSFEKLIVSLAYNDKRIVKPINEFIRSTLILVDNLTYENRRKKIKLNCNTDAYELDLENSAYYHVTKASIKIGYFDFLDLLRNPLKYFSDHHFFLEKQYLYKLFHYVNFFQ